MLICGVRGESACGYVRRIIPRLTVIILMSFGVGLFGALNPIASAQSPEVTLAAGQTSMAAAASFCDGGISTERELCLQRMRTGIENCLISNYVTGGRGVDEGARFDMPATARCISVMPDAPNMTVEQITETLVQHAQAVEPPEEGAVVSSEAEQCAEDGGTWVNATADAEAHCEEAAAAEPRVDNETCNLRELSGTSWFTCPTARFLAGFTDTIYVNIVQQVLTLPALTANPSLQQAWGATLSIANVAFVIAFLFVIYSQITGMGISNYGIKKMLPKLVVGAILINLSFWICALAVDLSNVTGASLYQLLRAIGGITYDPHTNAPWTQLIHALLAGGGVAAFALTVSPPLAQAALTFVLPALLAVVVALIVGFVVIALRQGLAVILTILAPLAFAAALLPNTENWFDRWKKLFITVLVFYPLFAVVFGGAQVAGNVLIATAGLDMSEPVERSAERPQPELNPDVVIPHEFDPQELMNIILLVVGLVVMVLPLFAAPFLWKYSGGLLGRIAGNLTSRGGRAFAPISKRSADKRERKLRLAGAETKAALLQYGTFGGKSKFRRLIPFQGAARSLGGAGKRADEQATRSAKYAQAQGYADALQDPTMAGKAAGNYSNALTAQAQAQKMLVDLKIKNVKAQKSRIQNSVITDKQALRDLAKGNSNTLARDKNGDILLDSNGADLPPVSIRGVNGESFDGGDTDVQMGAIQTMFDTGDYEGMNVVFDHMTKNNYTDSAKDLEIRHFFADSLAKSDNRPEWMTTEVLQTFREGGTLQNEFGEAAVPKSELLVMHAINNNEYSSSNLAGKHPDELKVVLADVRAMNDDDPSKRQFYDNVAAIYDPATKLDKKVTKARSVLDEFMETSPYGDHADVVAELEQKRTEYEQRGNPDPHPTTEDSVDEGSPNTQPPFSPIPHTASDISDGSSNSSPQATPTPRREQDDGTLNIPHTPQTNSQPTAKQRDRFKRWRERFGRTRGKPDPRRRGNGPGAV